MSHSRIFDPDEFAEIERDLDKLETLLRASARKRPRRRAVPAVGGGEIASGRVLHDGLRPRPAAFARAMAAGLKPIPAAFQAGYRAPNRMTVWRLMQDPRVRAEIKRLASSREH